MAESSPSACATQATTGALLQAYPGAWQSFRTLQALLAVPPWNKSEGLWGRQQDKDKAGLWPSNLMAPVLV